jgi:hypothetical protein
VGRFANGHLGEAIADEAQGLQDVIFQLGSHARHIDICRDKHLSQERLLAFI